MECEQIIIDTRTNKEARPIFCKCGQEMIPIVMSNIIDYTCPKSKFFNFFLHSNNKAYKIIK